jgi:predicted NAD/FAD-dependent oxidoreductase
VSRVAIVGAGPAGLIAARRIQDAGGAVTVFDKGRRPGGRLNTREHGARRFDHGAQFFTVRDDRVRPLLADWLQRDVVKLWEGRLVRLTGDTMEPARPAERYVGSPEMISLARDLAAGLDVHTGVRIETVVREGSFWRLHDDAGVERGSFERVVVAVPAAQAAPLLHDAPELQQSAGSVDMAPCWAGMFVFRERPPLDFDGAFVSDGDLSWVARDASKPGRPADESWVVHATPEWTRRHWDVDRAALPGLLLGVLEARFGAMPVTVFTRAHRWGYALASEPAPGTLWDDAGGIGAAGDWCAGGRVEGALTSGIEIADRVLASI